MICKRAWIHRNSSTSTHTKGLATIHDARTGILVFSVTVLQKWISRLDNPKSGTSCQNTGRSDKILRIFLNGLKFRLSRVVYVSADIVVAVQDQQYLFCLMRKNTQELYVLDIKINAEKIEFRNPVRKLKNEKLSSMTLMKAAATVMDQFWVLPSDEKDDFVAN